MHFKSASTCLWVDQTCSSQACLLVWLAAVWDSARLHARKTAITWKDGFPDFAASVCRKENPAVSFNRVKHPQCTWHSIIYGRTALSNQLCRFSEKYCSLRMHSGILQGYMDYIGKPTGTPDKFLVQDKVSVSALPLIIFHCGFSRNVEILQFSHPWAMLHKNILTVIYGQERRHPLIPIWCPLFCQCVVVSLINGRHVLNFIQNFWHWHGDRKTMWPICMTSALAQHGAAVGQRACEGLRKSP